MIKYTHHLIKQKDMIAMQYKQKMRYGRHEKNEQDMYIKVTLEVSNVGKVKAQIMESDPISETPLF